MSSLAIKVIRLWGFSAWRATPRLDLPDLGVNIGCDGPTTRGRSPHATTWRLRGKKMALKLLPNITSKASRADGDTRKEQGAE